MVAFNIISLKLKEMYQMITLGGDAELELVDSLDPFSEVRGRSSSVTSAGPCNRFPPVLQGMVFSVPPAVKPPADSD